MAMCFTLTSKEGVKGNEIPTHGNPLRFGYGVGDFLLHEFVFYPIIVVDFGFILHIGKRCRNCGMRKPLYHCGMGAFSYF